MGCLMSLKLHILPSLLNEFQDNLGAFSDEQDERFHLDIEKFEKRYESQYNEWMMEDYIWRQIHECHDSYKWKSR